MFDTFVYSEWLLDRWKRIPVESNLSKSETINSMGFCWHANQVILIIKIHAPFRFKKPKPKLFYTKSYTKSDHCIALSVLLSPSKSMLLWDLFDVTLACGDHATSQKVMQPLLALLYRIFPTKPVAEVWSKFWSWSFVKILKLVPASLLTSRTFDLLF